MDKETAIQRARDLRQQSTDTEHLLWRALRSRRLQGHKFRRQHVVGPYILDFYCPAAKLAIEVDGGGHAEPEQQAHDQVRTRFIEARGIRLLRFWNHDVLRLPEAVLGEIDRALAGDPELRSPRPPSAEGRGLG